MDQAEVLEVLRIIKFSYPSFRVSDEDAREMLNLWHKNLADVPANLVHQNLKSHIASERFTPTIAELRQGFSAEGEWMKRMAREHLNEMEAAEPLAVPPPAIWYELKQKLVARHE